MHFGAEDSIVLLGLLAAGAGAPRDRAGRPGAVPHPPRARRPRPRLRSWHADHRALARPRARRIPAAAPLRRSLLHAAPGATGERGLDLDPRSRSRAGHDGRRRGSRPRCHTGADLADGLRARSDRLPHRPDSGHRDRPAARAPAPADRDHRGREPRQRRHRSRRLPRRRRRRRHRQLLARLGLGALRAQRDRRHPRRAGGRHRDPTGPPPAEQSARRDHDLDPQRVLRVSPRSRARRFRRAGGRHRRRLHGLVHARADDLADAASGPGGVGDRVSRPERGAVRARRAPAAGDPRRAVGCALDRGAPWLRRARDGRRRARSVCLGGRRRLHAADDARRRQPAVEGRRRPLLVRHARRGVTRRRPGAPADDRRGRSLPRTAT